MNLVSKTVVGATFVLTAFSMLPANAANFKFSAIYSFGDSLSDKGNDLAFSQQPFFPQNVGFPPNPYFQGRFTNGFNWVDYLAEDLKLDPVTYASVLTDPTVSSREGINFAFGGALTDNRNLGNLNPPFFPFLGVEQQVDAFASLLDGKKADSKALYTLWAGSNDYVNLFSSPAQPSFLDILSQPFKSVNNLSNSVQELSSLGARDIVIFNLPNIGDTPIGSSNRFTANALTGVHNFLLQRRVAQLQRALPKTNLILFDVNRLFGNVVNNPSAFGFGNVTDNCTGFDFPNVDPTNPPPNLANCLTSLQNDPKSFIFWDNQHPVTAAHEIIADSVLQTLLSKPHPRQSTASLTLASQSLDGAPVAIASEAVPVPEPATVPAIGLAGLLLLGKTARKRSHS